MRSRRYEEEHLNHERWLVSYADFITLLFAFFVVMYAISSVNEGKYRVLSSSLEDAFRDNALSGQPIQVGDILRTLDPEKKVKSGEGIMPDFEPSTGFERPSEDDAKIPKGYQDGDEIVSELEEAASTLKDAGFEIEMNEKWVEVNLSSEVLFGSGNARLSSEANPVFDELAAVISGFHNPVRVEGFTDNRPIRTVAFPSNWELSAARAASVVNYFAENGVDPHRMAAVGYGEYRPISDNDTADGREKNRRIKIMISTDPGQLRTDAEKREARLAENDPVYLNPDLIDGITKDDNQPEKVEFLHSINQPGPEGFEE